LSLFEFGRVLYHLNKRRGFKSNRKADSQDKDEKKLSDYKLQMKALDEEIKSTGCRTLGEYLFTMLKKRKLHTTRQMYVDEFSLLWDKQASYDSSSYTEAKRAKIFKCLFHQRPLKVQKHLVGKCTLEPSRSRAAKSLLAVQRFRIWQDLNHLEIEGKKLSLEDRQRLFEKLDRGESLTWHKAKQLIGLHKNVQFNIETGKKDKLPLNTTAAKMKKALGENWFQFSEREQDKLIEDMLTIEPDEGFQRRMRTYWQFDDETIRKLSEIELEKGYARLSAKAIRRILPHLETGLRYDEACEAAGYNHSDQQVRRISERLPEPPNLRNPVVQKALWETRKLVNAVIDQYGRPAMVRVEMARDMKMNQKQKDAHSKLQKQLELENKKARILFQEQMNGAEPSRDDIIKYRLWNESDKLCPYTGRTISEAMLFSGEVDIEHILPYSRCLDDSFMNKTLCIAEENRNVKRNLSPFEAYSGSPEKYDSILVRIRNFAGMPEAKKRKFSQQEISLDDFIERQLNDTRYICKEVKDYLRQLGIAVDISKGGATADLRHLWQLNRILNLEGHNSKTRDDHRHHAVDAVVVALTSRSLFQQLSKLSQRANNASLTERGYQLPLPWEGFLDDVRRSIESITVSHASSRKISGALHEETAYGLVGLPDKNGRAEFAVRKPLSSFSKRQQLEDIRDDVVRDLALARLDECQGNFKEAFGNVERPLLHVDGKTPIYSVRVSVVMDMSRLLGICDASGSPYKYFSLGSNHHVEILESQDGKKWEGKFVSTVEAARRAKAGIPVFQKDHGPDRKYVMSLCINDMIELESKGQRQLYRVQKMSDPVVDFRLHTAAVLAPEIRRDETEADFR
ncbi:type II CRISPR RNA-guided endonuclease Cas9, partial [bacterium]|nr:type II CRISPR RNA-guided endonuclease Cas9 [bacterium]